MFRKFSLRVNRLIRTNYGPFSLGAVPQADDLVEVRLDASLQKILYQYYNDRAERANQLLVKTTADTQAALNEKVEAGGKRPDLKPERIVATKAKRNGWELSKRQ